MHNFGVYASSNQFEFNGTNPVVLIKPMEQRKHMWSWNFHLMVLRKKFI